MSNRKTGKLDPFAARKSKLSSISAYQRKMLRTQPETYEEDLGNDDVKQNSSSTRISNDSTVSDASSIIENSDEDNASTVFRMNKENEQIMADRKPHLKFKTTKSKMYLKRPADLIENNSDNEKSVAKKRIIIHSNVTLNYPMWEINAVKQPQEPIVTFSVPKSTDIHEHIVDKNPTAKQLKELVDNFIFPGPSSNHASDIGNYMAVEQTPETVNHFTLPQSTDENAPDIDNNMAVEQPTELIANFTYSGHSNNHASDTGSNTAVEYPPEPVDNFTLPESTDENASDIDNNLAVEQPIELIANFTYSEHSNNHAPNTGSNKAVEHPPEPVDNFTLPEPTDENAPDIDNMAVEQPTELITIFTYSGHSNNHAPDTHSNTAVEYPPETVDNYTLPEPTHENAPDIDNNMAAEQPTELIANFTYSGHSNNHAPNTDSNKAVKHPPEPVDNFTLPESTDENAPDIDNNMAVEQPTELIANFTYSGHSNSHAPNTDSNKAAEHPPEPVDNFTLPELTDENAHIDNNMAVEQPTELIANFTHSGYSNNHAPVTDSNTAVEHPPGPDDSYFQCPGPSNIRVPDIGSTLISKRNPEHRGSKRIVSTFKKSFMDFLSDEENLDFSAGSSDEWSLKESGNSSDESCINVAKKLKKMKKKEKKKMENTQEKEGYTDLSISKKRIKKENVDKKRKKMKDEGKQYNTRSGNEREEKSLKDNPCVEGKCARGCFKITDEKRKEIFDYFYSLEPQRRKDWIVRCAHAIPIKRKKTITDTSRRTITYDYYINEGNGHRKVCQKFLLKTLDVTQKYLLYTIYNAREGMAQVERRQPNAPIKYNEVAKTYARQFIEKLPAVPSHYVRKDCTRVYLPEEFKNMTNLYRLYSQDCSNNLQERISEAVFTKMFKEEYNIGFHSPKKDKCALCIKHTSMLEKTPKEIEEFEKHKEEKKASYDRFKVHQNLNDSETITSSFDLQKVLNTPHGQSMVLYYSRKYAVYNLTFYENGSQDGYCFTWGESDARRGSCEIATCLYLYLKKVDSRGGIKNVLLYCDSSAGQNKNKVILSTINYFLKSSKNIERIQINYLLPGHTYMPVDSIHAIIEREVRKLIVWSPSQWPTYMESARKRPRPYKVDVLEYTDFLNWEEIAAEAFSEKTFKSMKISKIRVATFKKKDLYKFDVKYSMKNGCESHSIRLFEMPEQSNIRKGRGKTTASKKKSDGNENKPTELKPLYTSQLPVSVAKYKDLKKLCDKDIIPRRFHAEYIKLPYFGKAEDKLMETDTEDDETDDYWNNKDLNETNKRNCGSKLHTIKGKEKDKALGIGKETGKNANGKEDNRNRNGQGKGKGIGKGKNKGKAK